MSALYSQMYTYSIEQAFSRRPYKRSTDYRNMIPVKSYAAHDTKGTLSPFLFERRALRDTDVLIDIKYCGVCHTDIHQARNEWGRTVYPVVPGHEIVGTVQQVGKAVTKYKVGDRVGVGCFVDSCGSCQSCKEHQEQYCDKGPTSTYNAKDKQGEITRGGYSSAIVVQESFVLKIPDGMDLASAAPLLCAGITTYSPLMHWKIGQGMKVGIVGLGGLGHMALKFAHSMGAQVVQFTTSQSKIVDAKRLGAHEVILSSNPQAMQTHAGTFDFILDTVSAEHDINALIGMLKRDGQFVMLGAPAQAPTVIPFLLIMRRRNVAGSLVGGIRETQEMLDYCAKHGITSDIEVIPMSQINEAYERTLKGDVKYRFVIDMATLH